MTTQSAQGIFRELLKDSVAPKLRASGFKGSGQNFSLPSESHWALIGFQKSAHSDAASLRFTINLYVVSKAEWECACSKHSYFPARPTASVAWQVGWWKRIGSLLPQGRDHWWLVGPSTDLVELAREVVETICARAKPAMIEEIRRSEQRLG